MPVSECECCGGNLHWFWEDAFDKFGFDDGEGQVETETVADVLRSAGYVVATEPWGLHNIVIVSIERDGTELIPYGDPNFTFGYNPIRSHLPQAIVDLLDSNL